MVGNLRVMAQVWEFTLTERSLRKPARHGGLQHKKTPFSFNFLRIYIYISHLDKNGRLTARSAFAKSAAVSTTYRTKTWAILAQKF